MAFSKLLIDMVVGNTVDFAGDDNKEPEDPDDVIVAPVVLAAVLVANAVVVAMVLTALLALNVVFASVVLASLLMVDAVVEPAVLAELLVADVVVVPVVLPTLLGVVVSLVLKMPVPESVTAVSTLLGVAVLSVELVTALDEEMTTDVLVELSDGADIRTGDTVGEASTMVPDVDNAALVAELVEVPVDPVAGTVVKAAPVLGVPLPVAGVSVGLPLEPVTNVIICKLQ